MKTTIKEFLKESNNNIIDVFHGGEIEGDITSPFFVTDNEYHAQTYGDIIYKFELNLNSRILDLTDIKTFKKIKSKIYDNHSKLYKKYINKGFWLTDKQVENDFNVLKKYKNYDEIEKTYKELKVSDFWDKVPGLESRGFQGYYNDDDYAIEYARQDDTSRQDVDFIKDFLILHKVVTNMTELNDRSLNEFSFFFSDYCEENGYDAYKGWSSDSSGRNRIIEYYIINLDIINYISRVNEVNNINMKTTIKEFLKEKNNTEVDNYSTYKGLSQPYQKRRLDFLNSIKTFKDIDSEEKIRKIFDYIGTEGYNDEEDAFEDFKDKVEEWQKFPDPVKLYRVVGVKDKKAIKKDELGEHWTPYEWNIDGDMLLSIGSELWDDETEPYVIEALVPLSEIDVMQTIVQNLSFPNEHEVNIKNKAKNVDILKTYKMK